MAKVTGFVFYPLPPSFAYVSNCFSFYDTYVRQNLDCHLSTTLYIVVSDIYHLCKVGDLIILLFNTAVLFWEVIISLITTGCVGESRAKSGHFENNILPS